MVRLLAWNHSILRRRWLLAEPLRSLQFLNDLLGEEQFFFQKLGGGLGGHACLPLRLLLLLLSLLGGFLLLQVELLLLGVGELGLLHLDFLGGDVGTLVQLALPLVDLVHLLRLGGVLALHRSCRVELALLGLGVLGRLLLLDETVAAGRGVAPLAGLHVGELLSHELRVHRRRELLRARVLILAGHA